MAEQKKTYRLSGFVCTNPDEIGATRHLEFKEVEFQAVNDEEAEEIVRTRYIDWTSRTLAVKTD